MKLGRVWDFVMRRKLICAVFAVVIALIFLVIFNIVQHISASDSIQSWFSRKESDSYLSLPCFESDADTSGGENRTAEDSTVTAEDLTASVGESQEADSQPSFQIGVGQILGIVVGAIFFVLFIRFLFDHFVR